MRNFDSRRETSQRHPKSKTQHPKFSIGIDLGSNTLRAVKRDCEAGRFVAEYEKIVRTADGLESTRKISDAAAQRIVEALNEAREAVGFDDAKLRAVTTEAMRRALNREEMLRRIEEATGVRFELIDAAQEAELTLRAVEGRLRILQERSDSFVLVDIGGGSTELTFVRGERMVSRSFPVGIVTMAQKYPDLASLRQALPRETEAMQEFAREAEGLQGKPERFVATAGTPTTVAALKLGMDYRSYDAARVNGTLLNRSDLEATLRRLLSMSPKERERAVGVGRADLISAGILIFDRLFEILGFESCLVIDDGLREGVALELCDESVSGEDADQL